MRLTTTSKQTFTRQRCHNAKFRQHMAKLMNAIVKQKPNDMQCETVVHSAAGHIVCNAFRKAFCILKNIMSCRWNCWFEMMRTSFSFGDKNNTQRHCDTALYGEIIGASILNLMFLSWNSYRSTFCYFFFVAFVVSILRFYSVWNDCWMFRNESHIRQSMQHLSIAFDDFDSRRRTHAFRTQTLTLFALISRMNAKRKNVFNANNRSNQNYA